MSTATPVIPDSSPIVLEKAKIRSWKAPIAFGVFVVLSLILFFGFPRHGTSTFRFSESTDKVSLPNLTVEENLMVATFSLGKQAAADGLEYTLSLFPELEKA